MIENKIFQLFINDDKILKNPTVSFVAILRTD